MNNGMFDLRQGKTTRKDNNMEVPSTVVSEVARTLITFSGATIIPDIPEYYQKYPELLGFLSAQKMPWKESKTLAGEIANIYHATSFRWSASDRRCYKRKGTGTSDSDVFFTQGYFCGPGYTGRGHCS